MYNETLSKMIDNIENDPIWVSVDETTNIDRHCFANTILGK